MGGKEAVVTTDANPRAPGPLARAPAPNNQSGVNVTRRCQQEGPSEAHRDWHWHRKERERELPRLARALDLARGDARQRKPESLTFPVRFQNDYRRFGLRGRAPREVSGDHPHWAKVNIVD